MHAGDTVGRSHVSDCFGSLRGNTWLLFWFVASVSERVVPVFGMLVPVVVGIDVSCTLW